MYSTVHVSELSLNCVSNLNSNSWRCLGLRSSHMPQSWRLVQPQLPTPWQEPHPQFSAHTIKWRLVDCMAFNIRFVEWIPSCTLIHKTSRVVQWRQYMTFRPWRVLNTEPECPGSRICMYLCMVQDGRNGNAAYCREACKKLSGIDPPVKITEFLNLLASTQFSYLLPDSLFCR